MFETYFPEGGCTKRCESRLDCGHRCPLKCHIDDRHDDLKCQRECERRCPDNDHKFCYKKCWEECEPCPVPLCRTLPSCGHNQKMTCGTKLDEFRCTASCDDILKCGHKCPLRCHLDERHSLVKCNEPCERLCPFRHRFCKRKCGESCAPCTIVVNRQLPSCGHIQEMTCGTKLKEFMCTAPCDDQLDCGHKCPLKCHLDERHSSVKCNEPCDRTCPFGHTFCRRKCGDDCAPCPEVVYRELPFCGHIQQMTCGTDISMLDCPEPCTDKLDCGHKCPLECHQSDTANRYIYIHQNVTCTEPCQKMCAKNEHKHCQKKCWETCLPCPIPVTKRLPKCGHQHIMSCAFNVNYFDCTAPCDYKLTCGHVCPYQCQPNHSHMDVKCEDECERVCPDNGHQVCRKKCFEICQPCPEPVERKLSKCGHLQSMTCGTNVNTPFFHCQNPCTGYFSEIFFIKTNLPSGGLPLG